MKAETKSIRYANCGLFVANLLLLVINMFYVCNYYPHTEELKFDYSGIIVAVLGIEVTLLVGWNIYDRMTLERQMRKIVNENMSDAINEAVRTASLVSLAQLGDLQLKEKSYDYSVRSLFNALSVWYNNNATRDIADDSIYHTVKAIKEIFNEQKNIEIIMDLDQKELFVETAKQSGDNELIEIARKIKVL